MEMTHERWAFTNRYAADVFGAEDEVLVELTREARSVGLPGWAVTADVGRLLMILAATTRGRLALEIGTLGGYSTIWITRGLAPDGRVITIEVDDGHAAFARRQFERAGLTERIEIRRGAALDVLPDVAASVGPGSVDFAFIDADKLQYPAYFDAVRPLIAPGGFLVVDNAFGTGSTWIDDLSDPGTRATDEMNRAVAADPWFTSTALNVRQGIVLARRHTEEQSP